MYGARVLQPERRLGETWRETFERECVERAPAWIRERALRALEVMRSTHRAHSSDDDIPDTHPCPLCGGAQTCYRKLALAVYHGDPFSTKLKMLPEVEPEYFRPGAGKWEGAPTW
jgi:hypothetical protein